MADSGPFSGGAWDYTGAGGIIGAGIGAFTNPPQAQTQPGSYSPSQGSGQGYNYIPTWQAGADQYVQQLLQQFGGGAQQLAGTESQILNTAFDPQNALYKRTLDQVNQQTLENMTNAGIATTPAGQGVVAKTLSDFNIDWQNNLLKRELMGVQGASQALQPESQAAGQGMDYMRVGQTANQMSQDQAYRSAFLNMMQNAGIGGGIGQLLQMLTGGGGIGSWFGGGGGGGGGDEFGLGPDFGF